MLAAVGVGFTTAAAGCAGTRPPPGDCSVANRPGPDVGEPSSAPNSSTYPTGPPPIDDVGNVIDYADAYERAYRDHTGDAGTTTTGPITIETIDRRTYASPGASVVYRRRYRYEHYVYESDVATREQGTTRTVYYLDAERVFRAAADGRGPAGALDPDPWERGQTLACYTD